jgi:hypothetical protein
MSAAHEMLATTKALNRREFLLRLQAAGGLLLIADGLKIAKAADAPKYGAEGMEHGTVDNQRPRTLRSTAPKAWSMAPSTIHWCSWQSPRMAR